ncbi:MAG TPA: hypothetical protein VF753_14190 [Terriglobales bacterium]
MKKGIASAAAIVALAVMMLSGISSYAASSPLIFNAAGATVLFNTFALGAYSGSTCGTNIWTYKKGANGIDGRSSSIPAENGNVWIVWNNAQTTVCAYLALDGTVAAQLYFAQPRATISIPSTEVGLAGQNLVPTLTDTTLPQAVYNIVNGAAFNSGVLVERPEDAEFAENRALAALNTANYSGLGYGPGPIGTPILSTFSTASATPVAFAISGTDPITGQTIPSWTATDLGATPIIIFGNTENTGSNGDFSNTAAFQNINKFPLAEALNGNLAYTRDLTNVSGLDPVPLNVVLRDPLSGAYNVVEFQIPRSAEILSTQELGVNPSAPDGNPLNITNAAGGWRKRAGSSSEEIAEVGTSANGNVLGYSQWSTGNFASVVSSTRYFTVDGVDPLYASYAGGFFPTCTAPCPGLVQFTNIINGSYPIWNVSRVVTAHTLPKGVSTLIAAVQAQTANIPDFVPYNQLTVFRSHYTQSGKTPDNGLIAALGEHGGDVEGAVFPNQADIDFYAETGKELVGLKQ